MTLYDNPSKFVPLSDDSALSDILQLTAVTIMTRVNLTINNNWSHTKFDSIQNTFFVSKSGEYQFSKDCKLTSAHSQEVHCRRPSLLVGTARAKGWMELSARVGAGRTMM